MKKQVVVIHGGDSFDSYEAWFEYLKKKPLNFENIKGSRPDYWKENLKRRLGEGYEVIYPEMPNKQNAKYAEWKIWFETLIPYLNPEVLLVGHSMGAIFIPKYLSENEFPKKVLGSFLVATPYDDENEYSLADFKFTHDLSGFVRQAGKIFMYHSENDPVVPIAEFCKYQKILKDATFRALQGRGHFDQQEFPELTQDILSV